MVNVTLDLAEFAKAVTKTAHEHGWWEDPKTGEPTSRNMGEMLMLMTSELAEGLEAWRDGEPELWYKYPNRAPARYEDQPELLINGEIILGKPCGLASEFADTIIRILDTCETLGIPLIEALIRKAAYNETRPYRHGGKLA
jgi:NTP pyrophosphatase (non-canonical NTP hydrolase)